MARRLRRESFRFLGWIEPFRFLDPRARIRSPKSECSVTNLMFRSNLSDRTPSGGPHERASDAPVTRSYPRGTAGFTLSPSTGGTKTAKPTVIPDVTTPTRTGKSVSYDLSSDDKTKLSAILDLLTERRV